MTPEVAGGDFVGQQHELLDDAMSDVALRLEDIGQGPRLVQGQLGFGKIEVDGTSLLPLSVKQQGQLAHPLELGHQGGVTGTLRRIPVQQDPGHRGVGHPFPAANHTLLEAIVSYLSAVVDLHQHRQGQPVLPGLQAANPVGQLFGQHGDGPVGEIDRGAAPQGFPVQSRIPGHVVVHVGDVNSELEATVLQQLHMDGVIEILGRFAVDGDHRQVAEVGPPGGFGRRDLPAPGTDLFQDRGGKLHRNLVLANHDLDVHAHVSRRAQNLDYAPSQGLPGSPGESRHLDIDDLSIDGLPLIPFPNQDVLRNPEIMENHPVEGPVLLELPHQGRVPAVQDLDDPTLGSIAVRPPLQGGQHRVSLHGLAQMPGGNEHVALQFWRPLVRDDKAVAVPVDRDPARHQGLPGRNGIAVPLQLQQQPCFHHAVQHGPDLPPSICTRIQLAAELAEAADLGRRCLDQPHEGLFQRYHVASLEDFGRQATGAAAWRLGEVRRVDLSGSLIGQPLYKGWPAC